MEGADGEAVETGARSDQRRHENFPRGWPAAIAASVASVVQSGAWPVGATPRWASTKWRRARRGGALLLTAGEGHEGEDFKQHLRAHLGGVAGGVVLRRHFDHVAADDVEPGAAAHEPHGLGRAQTADLRRARARREGWIEAVHVEGHIGWAVANDLAHLLDRSRHAIALQLLSVDDGHAAVVGELPQVFGSAADADLDCPLGIQHPRQHGVPERSAGMEFGALEWPARVAMGVDVDQTTRRLRTPRLQDR